MGDKNEQKPKHALDPARWVDLYGDYLYSYALLHVRDASVAEDLVQETFLSAFRSKDNFKARSSEKTWLTSILKHKILDHFRKEKKENRETTNLDVSAVENDFFDNHGHWKIMPKNWTPEPYQSYENKEFWKVVLWCLGKMPERLKTVFLLREMDAWDSRKICKVLEISPTNLWVILYRARLLMRKCLEVNWFTTNGTKD